MTRLHIAPGQSAGGSLNEAIRGAGLDDEVLSFSDDLSCGPIASDEPSARTAWWRQFCERPDDIETSLGEFWLRAVTTADRLVVWFGRQSTLELAFFLAWADRLGPRPYQIIDVTGPRLPFAAPAAVSILSPGELRSRLGTERAMTTEERDEAVQVWRHLKSENAPFRVLTKSGLVSAPLDHFDDLLLHCASADWKKQSLIIGSVMVEGWPCLQVGDLMLHARVMALVEAGKLIAEGDPRDITSRVRSPG